MKGASERQECGQRCQSTFDLEAGCSVAPTSGPLRALCCKVAVVVVFVIVIMDGFAVSGPAAFAVAVPAAVLWAPGAF